VKKSKILGVIGGMGSVATAYIFNRIIELTPAHVDQKYIETFIHNNTRIPDRTQGILFGGESPLKELERSIYVINKLEVDNIILACITSHYFIPQLQLISEAEIIDGVKEAAKHIKVKYPTIKRAGILASTGAIRVSIFQKQLKAYGIEAVIMNETDQERYFTEPIYQKWGIKAGNFDGVPRKRIMTATEILRKNGADAIIAGCSEIPLVLDTDDLDVPLIDTIDILIKTAIDRCRLPNEL